MMTVSDKFFIEVDYGSRLAEGGRVAGNVYMQRRQGNRIIIVFAEVADSSIRSNITSGVVASMCLNYALMGERAERISESVLRTFSDEKGIGFTIVEVQDNGAVRMLEYGNPECMIIRSGACYKPMYCEEGRARLSEFKAQLGDRLVFVSRGVIASGQGTHRLPRGWTREHVAGYLQAAIDSAPEISAHTMAMGVIEQAETNDFFSLKDDIGCLVLYFRSPRKILVCTGPPFNEKKDVILADMVARYDGDILICGGTTAQIISRELSREINVVLRRDQAGLPPTSQMEGVTLITEGVLTLSKVKSMLERVTSTHVTDKGTDADVVRMFLEHDVIEFVVGTKINPMHQDPTLPVELELRRNLVKSLSRVLESKFMKQTKIQYI